MTTSTLRNLLLCLSLCTSLCAQLPILTSSLGGSPTGLNAGNHPSKISLRASGALASHSISVPVAPPPTILQLPSFQHSSANFVAAAAAQQMTVTPGGPPWSLTAVEGVAPLRGTLFGCDDLGLDRISARIDASPSASARFFGVAFAKAQQAAATSGTLEWQIIGRDSVATVGRKFDVAIAAGESAASINTRIRIEMESQGMTVFDVAIPSFGSGSSTLPGFGVDRFVFNGRSIRADTVSFLFLQSQTAVRVLPNIVSAGWFPAGGFAEYGEGNGPGNSPKPWVRGEGGYSPGDSYDVVLQLRGPHIGLLVIGPDRAALPLPNGGTLLVDPATLVDTVPFATNPHGEARYAVHIPLTPAVLGQTLHYQGVGIGPLGLRTTSGLYARVWQ